MIDVKRKHTYSSGQNLEICQGDITTAQVGAIVNAANSQLAHGGGVAAAISRSGGSAIQEESTAWVKEHGPASHDRPAYTSGGKMPCQYVIHAVGPIWGSGDEENKLSAAIKGSLELAQVLELDSIAFPAISTGIFGFPVKLAADIFMRTITAYFTGQPDSSLHTVKIVLFGEDSLSIFLSAFSQAFGDE